MKLQVRKGVFECNSSSTHSIAIANEQIPSVYLPEKCVFDYGEFGWEERTIETTEEKASYLYTSLYYVMYDDPALWKKYITFIFDTLTKHGVECEFNGTITTEVSIYNRSAKPMLYFSQNIRGDGYVDHGSNTREFVDAVCTHEDLLLSFLFSKKSFVMTGNDNDDSDVNIHVDYPYVEFYKGN